MTVQDMTAVSVFGRTFDLTTARGAYEFQVQFDGYHDALSCGLAMAWLFAETTLTDDDCRSWA